MTLRSVSGAVLAGLFAAGALAQEGETIAAKAARAQAEGERRLHLGFTVLEPVWVDSLDQALELYTVAVGRVVGRTTRISDERRIETWYKIRIKEILGAGRPVKSPPPLAAVPPADYPEELLPLGPVDGLMRVPGGAVAIDGVEVLAGVDNWAPLAIEADYLLFLRLPSDHRMLNAPLAGFGVMRIRDGDALEPVLDSSGRLVWRDIAARHGASLERLRRAVRRR